MELELEEKGLPEGLATKPVSGYLYFPLPSGKKRVLPEELAYLGDDGKVTVKLPPPPVAKR
jgi:hypothetical protein